MSPLTFLHHPERWFEALSKTKSSHAAAPNFAFEYAVKQTTEEQRRRWDLSSLRLMMSAGEPVLAATRNKFFEAFSVAKLSPSSFCPAYGLAEHTGMFDVLLLADFQVAVS